MQANTHFLFAVFLIKILENWWSSPLNWLQFLIYGLVAFLSHLPPDFLVKFTYHPQNAKPHDKFWVGYHIYAYLFSVIIFVWLMNPYWWIMVLSCVIDIVDWFILRVIFHRSNDRVWFHPWIMRIRDSKFSWIPDLTERNAAFIPEIIINGLLIWAIIIL